MRWLFITLLVLLSQNAWGWNCPEEENIIITAPTSGFKTIRNSVMIRGYLCSTSPYVEISNTTTNAWTLVSTDEDCDSERCISKFSTFTDGLALGVNDFTATIPGSDPESHFQIIKSALTFLER